MNVIIPMAGKGKRMRPHTLTTPKPLISLAGKPIVAWLVEEIASVCQEKIDNIGFIIAPDFGAEVEANLLSLAKDLGAKGHIFYQEEALGTAHAIYCAEPILKDKVIVAFADTIFKADFKVDTQKDATIWVQKVADPSAFGVVKLGGDGYITDFVEKPKEFVSDLAIIGIYYFREGDRLNKEIASLIDNKILDSGEYQLTRVLRTLMEQGVKFEPGQVDKWLDCGNKNATVQTHKEYIETIDNSYLTKNAVKNINSVIIPPVYIGNNVTISNSIIGPYVSLGDHASVNDARISNSILQGHVQVKNAVIKNSMIGYYSSVEGTASDLSIGDYNEIKIS